MNTYSTSYLLFIWLICLLALIISTSCNNNNNECFYLNNKEENKEMFLSEFNKVTIDLKGNYTIKQSVNHKIKLRGNANYLDSIKTEVGNNNLYIYQKGVACNDSYNYDVTISLPKLHELIIREKANIIIENFNKQSELNIEASKKSVININKFTSINKFYAQLSQGAAIYNHEEIDTLNHIKIKIGGDGSFRGYPLPGKKIDVEINGKGYCEVNSVDQLNVVILGEGEVNSKGMPSIYKRITGKGSVNLINLKHSKTNSSNSI